MNTYELQAARGEVERLKLDLSDQCKLTIGAMEDEASIWRPKMAAAKAENESLKAQLATAQADAFERAAKAMCFMCKNDGDVKRDPAELLNGSWVHFHTEDSNCYDTCEAQRIHDIKSIAP